MHEAYCWEHNSFLTLTYSDEHLPPDLSLNHSHFQLFMKRLRERLHRKHGVKVRYLMCGEYGDKFQRPHYHACLFGWDFPDKYDWRRSGRNMLSRSPLLDELWPHGFCSIGEFTENTAKYVAGYVTKKVRGEALEQVNEQGLKPYELFDSNTGQIIQRTPEYAKMSRNPGLGAGFYELFGDEIRRDDFCLADGHRVRVPAYYDALTEKWDSAKHAAIRDLRRANAKRKGQPSPERRRAKEDYLRAIMRKGAVDNIA